MAQPSLQRQFFGRAAASAAVVLALTVSPLAAQQAGRPAQSAPDSVGRLWNPGAVQQRDRAGLRENDSTVKAIEGKMRCTCGCNLDVFTCRTTDFTCATSPAMHRLVLARLDSGMTAEQVITAFERQYGQAVLMAPPRRGFNWTAYVMPFVGLGLGLGIVVGLMRRWMRARPKEEPVETGTETAAPAPGAASDAELERLKRELERFEA
jgi:cytochrome c-type biogenesis protein CcmH